MPAKAAAEDPIAVEVAVEAEVFKANVALDLDGPGDVEEASQPGGPSDYGAAELDGDDFTSVAAHPAPAQSPTAAAMQHGAAPVTAPPPALVLPTVLQDSAAASAAALRPPPLSIGHAEVGDAPMTSAVDAAACGRSGALVCCSTAMQQPTAVAGVQRPVCPTQLYGLQSASSAQAAPSMQLPPHVGLQSALGGGWLAAPLQVQQASAGAMIPRPVPLSLPNSAAPPAMAGRQPQQIPRQLLPRPPQPVATSGGQATLGAVGQQQEAARSKQPRPQLLDRGLGEVQTEEEVKLFTHLLSIHGTNFAAMAEDWNARVFQLSTSGAFPRSLLGCHSVDRDSHRL